VKHNADVKEAYPTALDRSADDAVDGALAMMVIPFSTMVMGPLSNVQMPLWTVRTTDDPDFAKAVTRCRLRACQTLAAACTCHCARDNGAGGSNKLLYGSGNRSRIRARAAE
jgi:hypothetical protein